MRRLRLSCLRDPYLWLVLVLALVAALPLAGPLYFFDAHDAWNTVFFLTEFDAAIRDGVWYPGWATDQALGYGYPTFVFIPALAYYAAEGFHLLGADQVAAVKWTFALATLGAGLAMYLYARRVAGRRRGLLAAVVYVFIPYHLVDIYVRADLAEYSAFVWMPLCLLTFHELVDRFSLRRLGLAALTYGALWLTHNLVAVFFSPLLAAYILFRLCQAPASWRRRLARALVSLAAGMLGLGVAAALVLPNLLERQYIIQEQWVRAGYNYALHFLQPAHLLSPAWGYAPGGPGTPGGTSFQLGAVAVILAAAAALAALRRGTQSRRERALIFFFVAATLAALVIMMPVSAPLWKLVPIAALIQFPWRLLALTSVTLSILSAFAQQPRRESTRSRHTHGTGPRAWEPALLQKRGGSYRTGPRAWEPALLRKLDVPVYQATNLPAPTVILALVAVLASFGYTQPQYTPTPASAGTPLLSLEFELKYEDMRGMTAWTEEMPTTSPLVEQYLAGEPLVTAAALAPGASVEMIRTAGASDELWVRSEQGTPVQFYTYYFPGWRVYVDGERLPDSALRPEGRYGLLAVDVPPGEHHVLLRWGDTAVRGIGKAVSLVSIVLALGLVVSPRLRRHA